MPGSAAIVQRSRERWSRLYKIFGITPGDAVSMKERALQCVLARIPELEAEEMKCRAWIKKHPGRSTKGRGKGRSLVAIRKDLKRCQETARELAAEIEELKRVEEWQQQ